MHLPFRKSFKVFRFFFQCWSAEGYNLWLLASNHSSSSLTEDANGNIEGLHMSADSPKTSLVKLPFAKSCLAMNPCMVCSLLKKNIYNFLKSFWVFISTAFKCQLFHCTCVHICFYLILRVYISQVLKKSNSLLKNKRLEKNVFFKLKKSIKCATYTIIIKKLNNTLFLLN